MPYTKGIRDVPTEQCEYIVFVLNMRTHPTIGILSSTHALKHGLVEPQLKTGLVKHLPLVAVPGDQTVDLDRLGLANTMTPGLSLDEDTFRKSDMLVFTYPLSAQDYI